MRALVLALLLLAAMVIARRCRARAQGYRRSRARAPLPLLAVLLTLAVPTAGLTQAKPAGRGPRLEYTRGPAACLREEDFALEVYLITRSPTQADAPDVVKVWCEKGAMGFTCRIQYVDASGKAGKIQRIDGWDCWRVGREAAITASEFLPDATCPAPPPCPAPEPCPACPPAKPCRCPPERVCPLPPKPPKSLFGMPTLNLYAMGLLTGGLFADPGAAVALGIEARGAFSEDIWKPEFGFALEPRIAFPARVDAREALDPNKPTIVDTYNVGQFGLSVIPCARWRYFFGCGVLQFGFYWRDSPAYLSAGQPSLALGPRAGVRIPLGDHFALFAFGEALFAPVRLGFASPPEKNVYWLPSVAQGYGAGGIEFTF